jgi:hypothetical protein
MVELAMVILPHSYPEGFQYLILFLLMYRDVGEYLRAGQCLILSLKGLDIGLWPGCVDKKCFKHKIERWKAHKVICWQPSRQYSLPPLYVSRLSMLILYRWEKALTAGYYIQWSQIAYSLVLYSKLSPLHWLLRLRHLVVYYVWCLFSKPLTSIKVTTYLYLILWAVECFGGRLGELGC